MSWQYTWILLFVYLLSFAVLSGPYSWWTLGLEWDLLWQFRWLWQLHLGKWGFRESSTRDSDHSRGLVTWINQCVNQSILIAINPLWINLNRSTHCLLVMPGAGTDPCQRKGSRAGFRGASYPQAPWCHPCNHDLSHAIYAGVCDERRGACNGGRVQFHDFIALRFNSLSYCHILILSLINHYSNY